MSTLSTDFAFIEGKISFVIDSPNGSSGKAKISSYLTKYSNKVKFLLTSNSANASHTVADGDKKVIFKALPSGSLYHEKLEKVYICSGASFELKALFAEIEAIGIPRDKIGIHPRAAIIQQIDIDYEKGLCDLDGNYFGERKDGTMKTGTTASGSGAVLAKKTVRNKTLVTAKDCPELADMICITEEEILERLAEGQSGLFEIGQGFPLSNNYWRFAPHTTSRNVTISGALNDAFLPPSVVGNVVINTRTFPIRINSKKYISKDCIISFEALAKAKLLKYKKHEGGPAEMRFVDLLEETVKETFGDLYESHRINEERPYDDAFIKLKGGKHLTWDEVQSGLYEYETIDSYSGDWFSDQNEISWEEVEAAANIVIPQEIKNTTLTKLPRRIATFSKLNLYESIKYNQTVHNIYISVNFADFVDNDMRNKRTEITGKMFKWISENITPVINKYQNVNLSFIGTSEQTDDYVVSHKS